MLRGLLIGTLAIAAVLAVVAVVFAVGALRIALSESQTSSPPAPPAAPLPAPSFSPPATQQATDSDPPEVAVDHSIQLPAEQATLTARLRLSEGKYPISHRPRPRDKKGFKPPDPAPVTYHYITGWRQSDDAAEWTISIPKEGSYEVDLDYAFNGRPEQSIDYALDLADRQLSGSIAGKRRADSSYDLATVGILSLPAGQTRIRFHLNELSVKGTLNLRGIRLIPAS